MDFKFSKDQKASISRGLKKLDAGPDEWAGHEWSPWSKLRSVLEAKAVKVPRPLQRYSARWKRGNIVCSPNTF
jgi:hypothetical protein